MSPLQSVLPILTLIAVAGCSSPKPAEGKGQGNPTDAGQDAGSCCAPRTPDAGKGQAAPADAARDPGFSSVGAPVVATIGAAGGDVVLALDDGQRVTLSVPPGALSADTAIELQAVAIPSLPGPLAVRFSPHGLQFEVSGLLIVEPAPSGNVVGLTFDEVSSEPTLQLLTPERAGAAIPIEHFSFAAVAESAAARELLSEEDAALTELDDAQETAALAWGNRLWRVVEPAVRVSGRSVAGFRRASNLVQGAKGSIASDGTGALPSAPRGETLDALVARLESDLVGHGRVLFAKLQSPLCQDPGGEVEILEDWLRLPADLAAMLTILGERTHPEAPCLRSELIVKGPSTLAPDDDTVAIDVTVNYVGPSFVGPGELRELAGPSNLAFVVTGATGPTNFESRDGQETGMVFTRPSADRPHAVVIEVSMSNADIELAALEAPKPVRFIVAEPASLTASVTPSVIQSDGGTAEICLTLVAGGQELTRFHATAGTAGPGAVGAGLFLAPAACIPFTAPSPLPDVRTVVAVSLEAMFDGAAVSGAVEVVLERVLKPVATLTSAQITAHAGPLAQSCTPVTEEQTALDDAAPFLPQLNAEAAWSGSVFVNRTASASAQASTSVSADDDGTLHSLGATLSGSITTDVPDTRTPSCEILGQGSAEFLFSVSGGSMHYSVSESLASPAGHGSSNASSALFLAGTTSMQLYARDSTGALQEGAATGVLAPGNYRYVMDAYYRNNANVRGTDSGTATNTGSLTLTPVAPAP